MTPAAPADRRIPRAASIALLAALLLVTGGCLRGCTSGRSPIHLNPNMDYQEKLEPQEASDFFYDGVGMRPPVEGTVARGELEPDPRVTTGRSPDGAFVAASPLPADDALLARGEDRYAIYCAICHADRGDGRGVLQERANVRTTSLHDPRILEMGDGQLFDVITNGVGLMPGYRYPIKARDRWAIVAYVRTLQEREKEAGR